MNRTCNICGKNIAEADRFFIGVSIVKQLRKFFSGKCVFIFPDSSYVQVFMN